MAVIRSAGIRGFRAVVAELGGDAEDLALRTGFPPQALDADDLLVSDRTMGMLLELAALELDCPDLGLRVARLQDVSMLGPLALAMQSSATLGQALESAMAYLFVHSKGMRLTMRDDPYHARGVVALRLDMPLPGYWPVQGTDLTMGFIHRATEKLAGGPYGLRSVELPYRPPASLRRYEEFYGVPVRTGKPAALLRLPTSLRSRPLTTSDEDVRRLALVMLQRRAPDLATPEYTAQVHSTLAQSLGTATLDIAAVAGLLAMHPRTLQRKLADEGTSFNTVLDDVRRGAAKRLLTTTDLPLSQVAAMVGFAEPASLTRSARRWWGRAPSAVRKAAAAGTT
ncbi:AraC family transcriptional regulator [Nocardia asteroides NBRC 15531]|uniref:AraC family transcriptional regulator n=1 Tax=Nocardia asteroides NBRC 15531 TaxID=1110697 RepID=U5EI18_NOCAS|nr:AraC family transcriptional regulator [Nocardia asteroides]TLF63265.1 AraC family transcriptional regulator [Nocardia asteroides NBRC 15531]UGT47325.1 AraC family transcriptional regulator [Nocardia asteroides]SFM72430.1 AraC-type DNA-binding protein [Nocardia asteroides]VEG33781.1 transcriptional activator FtrA [Nocardia asteroides]GAD86940.1 putative AraC family transcriptional regulator [Nocardia asteroides NBRC 15531]